jgi:hypothetical protein
VARAGCARCEGSARHCHQSRLRRSIEITTPCLGTSHRSDFQSCIALMRMCSSSNSL